MYIMQISTHAPEHCPVFNKETKKTTLALMPQMDSLLAKHGIKNLGMWTDHAGHTLYNIFETPSLDAYWAFFSEPAMATWLSFLRVENKVVLGPEEQKAILARD